MTEFVDVGEAAIRLSRLLQDLATGDEVVITQQGEAIARLVSVRTPPVRRLGIDRGRFVVPEDFDRPLSDGRSGV